MTSVNYDEIKKEERQAKGSVTLALIVSRNFGLRDDSLPRERDKRERGWVRKKRRNRFIFLPVVSFPPSRHRSLPFIQRVACAAPKRGRLSRSVVFITSTHFPSLRGTAGSG